MARLTELLLSDGPSIGNAPTTYRSFPHHLTGRPSNNRHTPANFARRFWRRVDQRGPDECWLWKGSHLATGRGQVHLRWEGTKNVRANAPVVSWLLTHGNIPKGLNVCHNCPTGDNPRCVNPNHLFLGTQKENIHDSICKGRYNVFGIQKLNAAQVLEIRALAARGLRQRDIAQRFGIARNTVSAIVHRKSWDHLKKASA